MTTKQYDCIVIGSGQGGTPLSTALAALGRRTALVESTHIGGTCVNEGCTPTKTMVASARAAYIAARGSDFGVKGTEGWKMDMETVRKRKRNIVESFRGGSEQRVQGAEGLEFYLGKGKFVGEKEIEVETENKNVVRLKAESIFINTGCRPTELGIPGIEQIEVLNSTSIMELGIVPEHLIVIGGGYVGLEFAQMFRRFGSQVTVVQKGGQLVGTEDKDVAEAVKDIMIEDGMTVLLNMTPVSVAKGSSDEIELMVKSPDEQTITVRGSHLLAAAGRAPNTDYLSPGRSGIAVNKRGFITVNEYLETNVPGIYALGDVKGGPAFTHISYDDFRIIRTNLIDSASDKATTSNRVVPYVMYIDPQLGRIGLSESEAVAKYGRDKIQVAKMPFSYVARALEIDETRGFMKAVVEKESGLVLGFLALGPEGGELMTMVQMAIMGGLTWKKLQNAVFAHPTFAESLNNLWGFLE